MSGVMTFMVNHDGVVFSKDLGSGHGETRAPRSRCLIRTAAGSVRTLAERRTVTPFDS